MSDLDQLQLYATTRDAAAFASLVAAYSDMVYATCLRILVNRAEAEDAAQECFWRLARESAAIRISVGAWLHRCATNECITRKRRKTARKQRDMAYETTRRSVREEAAQWSEIAPAVDQAIEELPDDLRRLLVAYFLQRRTQTELAAEMNLSPATMSRRIAEGVELIRKKLKSLSVLTSVGALAYLLATRTAAATPAKLVANLGRMAIAGPHPLLHLSKLKITASAGSAAAAATVALYLLFSGHSVTPPAARTPPPAQVAATPSSNAATYYYEPPVPDGVYAALYRVRNTLPQVDATQGLTAVRTLVTVGPSAIPAINAELNRSTREPEQRLLILTLRMLNHRDAMPALVNILPHLATEEAAYPVVTSDRTLLTFLQAHPAPGSRPELLRPARVECITALEQLTRHRETSPALWQTWYLTQTAMPRLPLDVPIPAEDPVARRGAAIAGAVFPTGPSFNLLPVQEIVVDAASAEGSSCQLGEAGTLRLIRERGGSLTVDGATLAAWPVNPLRFDTLPAEVHLNPRLDLGSDGPLPLHVAGFSGRQTFLFASLKGARGIVDLQRTGTGMRVQYRLYAWPSARGL